MAAKTFGEFCNDQMVNTKVLSATMGSPIRTPRRYLAIIDELRAEILAAPPNTALPTEEQLAARFRVSRPTLRRALGVLERGGLISRQRARGTTVSPPKVVRSLEPLYTIEEDFRRKGIQLETRVLQYREAVLPSQAIRDRLQCNPGDCVAVLSLLRLVEGRIVACDWAYLPAPLTARFRAEQVTRRALLEVICEGAGVRAERLDWEIEILPSSDEVAQVLGITPGVLVVASHTTAFAGDGSPLSRNERYYRIDRVKFHFVTNYAPGAAPGECDGRGGGPARRASCCTAGCDVNPPYQSGPSNANKQGGGGKRYVDHLTRETVAYRGRCGFQRA